MYSTTDTLTSARCVQWSILIVLVLTSSPVYSQSNSQTLADDSSTSSSDKTALPALLTSVQVNRSTVFVNEQLLLTVALQVPKIAFNVRQQKLLIDRANVFKLQKSVVDTTLNDTPYQLEKHSYAIYFKQPGNYKIPAMNVTATLPVSAGGINSNSNPKLSVRSTELEITVEQAPVSATEWLPALDIKIQSSWLENDAVAHDAVSLDSVPLESIPEDSAPADARRRVIAGEPTALLYKIYIDGQFPTVVPALNYSIPEGIRFYADPPVMQKHTNKSGVGGSLSQVVNLIPGAAGAYEIPPLRLRWWDIKNQQWRVAEAPAQSIDVLSASSAAKGTLAIDYNPLTTLLAATTAILSALCLFLWYRLRLASRSSSTTQHIPASRKSHEKQAWTALTKALNGQNPQQTRNAVLSWYSTVTEADTAVRLDQLAQSDPLLLRELINLDATLYRSTKSAATETVAPDFPALKSGLTRLRRSLIKNTRAASLLRRRPLQKAPANVTVYPLRKL